MANLYRLLIPMTDPMRSVLNGRNFNIKKTREGQLVFIDPDDGSVLLTTTHVVQDSGESESGTRTFKTNSGTFYSVIKLNEECSLPEVMDPSELETAATDESIQNLMEEYERIKVVNELDVERGISYGDGYDGTVFTFEEPVSYEAFLLYCQNNGYDLDKLKKYAWYEDHAAVSPEPIKSGERWNHLKEGRPGVKSITWTYLWVRAYTD